MMTKEQALEALRRVMTPDRFNRNGMALDTTVPGTILDALLREAQQ